MRSEGKKSVDNCLTPDVMTEFYFLKEENSQKQ